MDSELHEGKKLVKKGGEELTFHIGTVTSDNIDDCIEECKNEEKKACRMVNYNHKEKECMKYEYQDYEFKEDPNYHSWGKQILFFSSPLYHNH